MAIKLNIVGIDIAGKVYKFYKLSLGFQRKLVEAQTNINKVQNGIAKKYDIKADDVSTSEKVSEDEKLDLARKSLEVQDALTSLFVNPEEAKVLDNFDGDNIEELIEALS